MPFTRVNGGEIRVLPLRERKTKSKLAEIAIDPSLELTVDPILETRVTDVARRMIRARELGASRMIAFGAHLVKNGVAPILIKLMEQGWITHLATQGAGGIHDWEFAFMGMSEEDVRANVATGTFGSWEETGKYINLAVQLGALQGLGYGESLGAFIENDGTMVPSSEELKQSISVRLADAVPDLAAQTEVLHTIAKFNIPAGFLHVPHPFKATSIFAGAFRTRTPITVHPGIGYDIIYNHPFANGAALGRGGHIDFKVFVNSVLNLSDGVFLSIGSAIMAPQVFEKALSFANNILLQKGQKIHDHYMLVVDLQESTWDWTRGEPPKSSPDYYFRFLKSFFRMGGTTEYCAADNRAFLHLLYQKLQS